MNAIKLFQENDLRTVLLDSLQSYEDHKIEFNKIISEYFSWALDTCNKNDPNYRIEYNKRFKTTFEESLKLFIRDAKTGKPDELVEKDRKNIFNSGKNFYFLLLKKRQVIGLAGFKKINNTDGVLKSVFVKNAHQGKRYGVYLINKIIEQTRQKGYTTLKLETATFFEKAVCTYKSLGFIETVHFPEESFPKDWAQQMNLLYMKLDIQK